MSHIALILPDLNGGGAQKMMINLANEFCAQGNQVDLIILTKSGVYQNLIHENMNILLLNKSRAILSIPFLIQHMRKSKFDGIISALTYVNIITIISKIISFSSSSTLIISERNNLTRDLNSRGFLSKYLYKVLVYIFYPLSDYIVGISNGVCSDLKKYLNKKRHYKIKTIYNPVVTEDFESKLNKNQDDIYPPNSLLKIITSGRLEEQKDYPTMFKALSLYKEKYGDFDLVILGKGSLQKRLENLTEELGISKNISFLGFLENPLAAIKQADVFIISSAWEGFCNVIVEALYAGKQVVSTDCPFGPAEILANGEYGELVPVRDPEALCEAIYKVKNEPIETELIKMRALNFSASSKTSEFKDLIKRNA